MGTGGACGWSSRHRSSWSIAHRKLDLAKGVSCLERTRLFSSKSPQNPHPERRLSRLYARAGVEEPVGFASGLRATRFAQMTDFGGALERHSLTTSQFLTLFRGPQAHERTHRKLVSDSIKGAAGPRGALLAPTARHIPAQADPPQRALLLVRGGGLGSRPERIERAEGPEYTNPGHRPGFNPHAGKTGRSPLVIRHPKLPEG